MAKSDNFFNIRGKIGDIIFCERDGKTYVKKYSGGFTKESVQLNPNVKKANKRFAKLSAFVKNFKEALYPYMFRHKDGAFHNQLVSLFSRIANKDRSLTVAKILSQKESYYPILNQTLNKNSKLHISYSLYDPKTNTLELSTSLFQNLPPNYDKYWLELAMGWYSVKRGVPYLTEPVRQYIKIDLTSKRHTLEIPFPEPESKKMLLPFLSYTLVYSDSLDTQAVQPLRYIGACFLTIKIKNKIKFNLLSA